MRRMFMTERCLPIVVALTLALAGCGATEDQNIAHTEAASDLKCHEITDHVLGEHLYAFWGCGGSVQYACVESKSSEGWTCKKQ